MTKPLVSAYCLVYNHGPYLRECLESFAMQKVNFDYEVVIHDDASTDNSREIILEYVNKYPKLFKTILQDKNVFPNNWDYIAPKLDGKYVAILEGDDYWTDEYKLQKQVDFLESHPDYVACVHDSDVLEYPKMTKHRMLGIDVERDFGFSDFPPLANKYQSSSLVYKREFIKLPAFFEKTPGYDDYPLALYLSMHGKIHYLPEVMSVYRHNVEGSWSQVNGQTDKAVKVCEELVELLKAVDEYDNQKHHALLQKWILGREFYKAELLKDYKAMTTEPLLSVYKEQPLGYRVNRKLEYWFPNAYNRIKKSVGR